MRTTLRDVLARITTDGDFAREVQGNLDLITTHLGLDRKEAIVAAVAAASRDGGVSLNPQPLPPNVKTKILWPLDTPEEVALTENADGTRSASYESSTGEARTVVIHPDGSRDQTQTLNGGVWKIHQELTEEGVFRQRTLMQDNTTWVVTKHPGAILSSVAYLQPDGSGTETTHYQQDVTKTVTASADRATTTIWTNPDGVQRISD